MFQTLEQAIEEGRASLDLDVAASPNTHEEIPSPLAELALQIDNALPEPKPEPNIDPNIDPKTQHGQIAQPALNGANGNNGTSDNGIAHPPPNPAREETARVSLPRLSELRGMRFSQALRELDKAKRTAPANASPVSVSRSLNDALAYEHIDTPNSAFDDLHQRSDQRNPAERDCAFRADVCARGVSARGAERCDRNAPER